MGCVVLALCGGPKWNINREWRSKKERGGVGGGVVCEGIKLDRPEQVTPPPTPTNQSPTPLQQSEVVEVYNGVR